MTNHTTLTPEKFAALSELLSLRDGSNAKKLAEMILVEGVSVKAAAESLDVKYQQAHNALKRAERGIDLAKIVSGTDKD